MANARNRRRRRGTAVQDAYGGARAGVAAGVSAAAANKIADHTKRRTQENTESSSDGDALSLNSMYGAIQMGRKWGSSGTIITVYRTDGSTSLGTMTATLAASTTDVIVGIA